MGRQGMNVACPLCRSEFQSADKCSTFICPRCSCSFLNDGEADRVLLRFEPRISAGEAEARLRDFLGRFALGDDIRVKELVPCYFPFWESLDGEALLRANAGFLHGKVNRPADAAIALTEDYLAEEEWWPVINIQPKNSQSERIIYLPFYQAVLRYRDQEEFVCFIQAVSGDLHADPLPFFEVRKLASLVPFFLLPFVLLLASGFLFNPIYVAVPLSVVVLIVCYHLASVRIEKTNNRDEID